MARRGSRLGVAGLLLLLVALGWLSWSAFPDLWVLAIAFLQP